MQPGTQPLSAVHDTSSCSSHYPSIVFPSSTPQLWDKWRWLLVVFCLSKYSVFPRVWTLNLALHSIVFVLHSCEASVRSTWCCPLFPEGFRTMAVWTVSQSAWRTENSSVLLFEVHIPYCLLGLPYGLPSQLWGKCQMKMIVFSLFPMTFRAWACRTGTLNLALRTIYDGDQWSSFTAVKEVSDGEYHLHLCLFTKGLGPWQPAWERLWDETAPSSCS